MKLFLISILCTCITISALCQKNDPVYNKSLVFQDNIPSLGSHQVFLKDGSSYRTLPSFGLKPKYIVIHHAIDGKELFSISNSELGLECGSFKMLYDKEKDEAILVCSYNKSKENKIDIIRFKTDNTYKVTKEISGSSSGYNSIIYHNSNFYLIDYYQDDEKKPYEYKLTTIREENKSEISKLNLPTPEGNKSLYAYTPISFNGSEVIFNRIINFITEDKKSFLKIDFIRYDLNQNRVLGKTDEKIDLKGKSIHESSTTDYYNQAISNSGYVFSTPLCKVDVDGSFYFYGSFTDEKMSLVKRKYPSADGSFVIKFNSSFEKQWEHYNYYTELFLEEAIAYKKINAWFDGEYFCVEYFGCNQKQKSSAVSTIVNTLKVEKSSGTKKSAEITTNILPGMSRHIDNEKLKSALLDFDRMIHKYYIETSYGGYDFTENEKYFFISVSANRRGYSVYNIAK